MIITDGEGSGNKNPDEKGKPPLFPRLHIDDLRKDGVTATPRKMKDQLSVPLPKVKDPTPYIPVYGPTPSISSPLCQVVSNASISIEDSSKKQIIPNLNLPPPPSPSLTFDYHPNLKFPYEPKDPNEYKLPPYASIARASSSLEPQTTTTNKQKSPMPTEMNSKQKNKASSSYPVYPYHKTYDQGSMRDGCSNNIPHHHHHTQCIPLIENYGKSLGREERRQFIPIEESAVKECGTQCIPLIENYGQSLGREERRQFIPIEESAVKECGTQCILLIENYGQSLGREERRQFIPIEESAVKECGTQCIPLIENYGQSLGREERRQFIPIEESAVKECGTQCIPLIENYGQSLGREERRQFIPIEESAVKECSTQCIPLIENYSQSLEREERRQFIPIEESAVKECSENIVGDSRLAELIIPNTPLVMRSQSSEKYGGIIGNLQSNLQQMNIEHNKIENCKGIPEKASSSCPLIIPQAIMKKIVGKEYFSEARDIIIYQQQMFTWQVSQLHKIVMVQKELIKSSFAQQSNHLQLDTSLLPKPFPKAPIFNNSSRNEASKMQIMGSYPPQNAVRPTVLTGSTNFQNSNIDNTIISNFPPLYLPSQGNQLLCPMISPTEGLIYKFCSSLPNGGYTYIEPYSSILNMKSLTEFSPSPSSSVIRDETNPNEDKDTEKVNGTPTSPTENSVPKNVPTSPKLLELGQPVQICNNESATKVIKAVPFSLDLATKSRVVELIEICKNDRKK